VCFYDDLGLATFIDAFVISEEVGCTKPDPRMYHAGCGSLGLAPAECVFIDDDPELVRAARDLGFPAFAIDRRADAARSDVPTINALAELAAFAGARR
jgi:FMN phosphatase YigB (HAD superfamily)